VYACDVRDTVARRFVSVALSGLIVAVGVARAQTPPHRSTRSKATSEIDPARLGRQARAAGRWADAEAAFEAALESPGAARMTPGERAEVLGELGLCELKQREYRDAAEHLARSLDDFNELRPAFRGRINEALRKAQAEIGRILVAVSPPDAAVLVDDQPVGRAAQTYLLFVEPGRHTVRARLSGHDDAVQMFELAKGQKHLLSLQLSPVPAAAPPAKESALAAHRAAGAPAPGVARSPGPWAGWPGKVRVAGIAVTTAAASFGVLFMVRASVLDGDLDERKSELRDHRGWTSWACRDPQPPAECAELHGLKTDRDRFAGLGTALVAAGGVAGALTAASFFTDLSFLGFGPRKGDVAVIPAVAAGQAFVTVRGAF
jgi:tetratricopeptide (TPR) repeat protein